MAPTLADQDRLIVNKLAYRIGEPQIGDIVMLYYPLNPDKSFVKRVIAEEGDQVRIVDGRVYRNDVLIDDDFVPAEYRSHDDWGPEVIAEGYYFVMGDHRNNSSDSRHWGLVPKKYIIGKVQLRWWPLPHARLLLNRTAVFARPRPRSPPEPGGRRGQAGLRLRHRRRQHHLRRLPLAHRLRLERHGLVGLRAARKPPDEDHPYGHRKFETLAAAGIFVFLLLVVVEVGRGGARAAARRRAAGRHLDQLRA